MQAKLLELLRSLLVEEEREEANNLLSNLETVMVILNSQIKGKVYLLQEEEDADEAEVDQQKNKTLTKTLLNNLQLPKSQEEDLLKFNNLTPKLLHQQREEEADPGKCRKRSVKPTPTKRNQTTR